MADPRESMLGQLAVKKGLISGAQLAEVLRTQEEMRAATGRTMQLGDLLVERGLVDRAALGDLLRAQARTASRDLGGFELISRLGAGGMGAVYKARQKSLDRIVALKVLPPRLAKDQVFISRFFREARAVARLNHPNIVGGIDVGEASGYFYFAMELVEGYSLHDALEERGALEEAEALKFIEQVARALGHAHNHGLIHRDVKPDNVLIDRRGVAKLCDLGLARQTHGDSSLTQTGIALGTPHYISPEQARGESDIDGRADLYSLGATWFHLLAGQPPYTAENALAVVSKHLTEPVPRISAARKGISPGTEAVIAKLMAKEPAERYASAAELLKDLADLAAGRPPKLAGAKAAGHITSHHAPVRARDTRMHEPVSGTMDLPDLPDGIDLGAPAEAPAPGPLSRRPVQLALAALVLLAAMLTTWGLRRAASKPAPPPPDPTERPPGPLPGPGPGPEGSKERLEQLEEMLKHIRRTVAERPDDLDLHEERWKELSKYGAGTKYRLIAQDEIGRLAERRSELARRKGEDARRELAVLEKGVGELIAKRRFGPAAEQVKNFPRELVALADGPGRMAALKQRLREEARRAVETVFKKSAALAEAGRFREAREALDVLEGFGLPHLAPAREKALAKMDDLERDRRRKQEQAALAKCRRAIDGLEPRVKARKFAEALAALEKAAKGLPPEGELLIGPERALLAGAADFMRRCRDRARERPAEVRLTVQNVAGKILSYDPKSDEIVVVKKLRMGRIEGKGKLAELEVGQLLELSGWTRADALPPGEALAAGCFLAASGLHARAEPYIERARAGRAVPPELERAMAVRRKGEAEVRAGEKFAELKEAFGERRWRDAVSLGRELMENYVGTAFLAPRLAEVKRMLADAERETAPLASYTVVFQDGRAIPELGLAGYRGAADTYLCKVNDPGNVVHGSDNPLKCFSFGAQAPLLRFDLSAIPGEARVERAVLEVHCARIDYGFVENASRVEVYALKSSWDEARATYNHRFRSPAQSLPWAEPGARKDRDTTTNWGHGPGGKAGEFTCEPRRWSRCDLTRLAAAWVSGKKPNHGIYLHAKARGIAYLLSREEPQRDLRPRLTVTFRSKPLKVAVEAGPRLPREAKVYGLESDEAVREFVGEFSFFKASRGPESKSGPIGVGGGEIVAAVADGEALHLRAARHRWGRERSVSFGVDFSGKARKDRGYAAFGFTMGRRTDLDDRLALVCGAMVRGKMLLSGFYHDRGEELRSRKKPLIPGKFLKPEGGVLRRQQLRVSWRSPTVAWFLEGKRIGLGKLCPRDAREVAGAPVTIYCGLFHNRVPGDRATFRLSQVAVGLPHDKDFEGDERMPQPPDPGFEPGPGPGPRPWDPREGGKPPPPPRPPTGKW